MIKRTLYFGNPAYLHLNNSQMIIRRQREGCNEEENVSIPIEDVGYIILDHPQITITHGLNAHLLNHNVAVIHCDDRHMPIGLVLPLAGNTLQSERFLSQINASIPLKKQLWKQTIQAKLRNQAFNLNLIGAETGNMSHWIEDVKSGDTANLEARAAVYYWKTLFGEKNGFIRDRNGEFPNNYLNYGYAILRAVVARSLVASGLLPTLGIHHHNRYNAYCLADDIMEPYRPVVDRLVYDQYKDTTEFNLTIKAKRHLLSIPMVDVEIDGHRSPLMVAVTTTTTSLYKCYSGARRYICYPTMIK